MASEQPLRFRTAREIDQLGTRQLRAEAILFGLVALVVAAIVYGPHWQTWWLIVVDRLGELRGQPWPAADQDLLALAYWAHPGRLLGLVGLFAVDLLLGALAATVLYVAGIPIGILRGGFPAANWLTWRAWGQ